MTPKLISAVKETLKNLKNSVKYSRKRRQEAALDNILKYAGGCFPSEDFKRRNILEYFTEYNCDIFIETGTFYGKTTEFMAGYAKEIHTIELSEALYKKAEEKFKGKENIHCYFGDSKNIIENILQTLENKRPLIYLDAHYSGGKTAHGEKNTPIIEELKIIAKSNIKAPFVILIDDARFFGFEDDYPSLFKLKLFVKENFKNPEFDVYNDVIRIIAN